MHPYCESPAEERTRFFYRMLTLLLWQLGPQRINRLTQIMAPTDLMLVVTESDDMEQATMLSAVSQKEPE